MRVVEKSELALSDEQLILLYRKTGDRELVSQLFGRYYHLAFGACLKFVKNKADSRDLVVEIFEKLMDKLATEEVHNFNSWLYSLCKNESISLLRRQAAERNRLEAWAEQEKQPFLHNADGAWEDTTEQEEPPDRKALLRMALDCLPQEQKICLKLFYYKENSYQQIAEKTQFSLLQVKSYLQNGKRNLKKLLEEENR